MKHTYDKDMGASHAEFFRLLSAALGSSEYEVNGSEITFDTNHGKAKGKGGRRVRIILGPEGTRRIALFAIPTTPVNIELNGYDDDEAVIFMKRFDRAYHRGGG